MTSSSAAQSSVQALIPFTGFYTLDPEIGSFVMVGTDQVTSGASTTYTAKITVSKDGQTSEQFSLGDNCTFSDNTLVISATVPGGTSAKLVFDNSKGISSVTGTISNEGSVSMSVSGTSPFAPIDLALWSGTYYTQGPVENKVYPYTAMLKINSDGTVYFAADGKNLTPVQNYSYDYAMFVIALVLDSGLRLFEMGTASGWGRVAGSAENGQMLVSIRLQEPAPNL
ncbi:hypothetical protein [Pseudomonas sp. NPDC089734]|uniref:hypothetical protein n=1 Tax=Pseudomonas sp. NPDC089734 TaxID=3364469 RepID=UPI00381B0C49